MIYIFEMAAILPNLLLWLSYLYGEAYSIHIWLSYVSILGLPTGEEILEVWTLFIKL